jgi:hypothetical protein
MTPRQIGKIKLKTCDIYLLCECGLPVLGWSCFVGFQRDKLTWDGEN